LLSLVELLHPLPYELLVELHPLFVRLVKLGSYSERGVNCLIPHRNGTRFWTLKSDSEGRQSGDIAFIQV